MTKLCYDCNQCQQRFHCPYHIADPLLIVPSRFHVTEQAANGHIVLPGQWLVNNPIRRVVVRNVLHCDIKDLWRSIQPVIMHESCNLS